MKNKITISTLFLFLLLAFSTISVNAQTTSPTPTESDLQEKARKLLELVASDAAKLNLTEKRGIIGTVTDTSTTQITVEDINGNTRFIDVDELTKFSDPTAKGSFGISDIETGSTIGSLGLYNKSSRRILARFIDVITFPRFIHGSVSSIDEENFTFNMVTDENKNLTVDVETVTKTSSYTLSDGLVKSGFSKITKMGNIVVIGYPDKKDANTIIASDIILLSELASNPKINLPGSNSTGEIPSSAQSATTSTGSGKTLTPKIPNE